MSLRGQCCYLAHLTTILENNKSEEAWRGEERMTAFQSYTQYFHKSIKQEKQERVSGVRFETHSIIACQLVNILNLTIHRYITYEEWNKYLSKYHIKVPALNKICALKEGYSVQNNFLSIIILSLAPASFKCYLGMEYIGFESFVSCKIGEDTIVNMSIPQFLTGASILAELSCGLASSSVLASSCFLNP